MGVSATGILVGSQDVAQDLAELKKLGVTHILNVAGKYIPNAFPDVSLRLKGQLAPLLPCVVWRRGAGAARLGSVFNRGVPAI